MFMDWKTPYKKTLLFDRKKPRAQSPSETKSYTDILPMLEALVKDNRVTSLAIAQTGKTTPIVSFINVVVKFKQEVCSVNDRSSL